MLELVLTAVLGLIFIGFFSYLLLVFLSILDTNLKF